MTLALHEWTDLDASERDALLQRPAVTASASTLAATEKILAAVRASGDVALAELTQQHDGATLSRFRVEDAEFEFAQRALTKAQTAAIDLAIDNVRRFHEPQKPRSITVETMPGVVCERVCHPIDAVGLYVPAGTAPLPSAAIMLAVPARIAGCPTVVLCTPPRSDGTADPAVLVAAARAGVDTVFKIGGAQAIAAMAYGTDTVPKVSKVFGPGNSWVTAAKSIVSVDPQGAAIDLPAGPSEVLVIADASASSEYVAADLLSQAEHGIDSQVVLVTTSRRFAAAVQKEIEKQLTGLTRATIAAKALKNSMIVLVDDIAAAIRVSNDYAPEHLILQITGARDALATIRNAGSVFVGRWTPESVGDYCSGTNHVLPTYGYARNYSGLGVEQFMRQMTVQELTREGLGNIGDAVVSLAALEGLDAHAAAVTRRLRAAQ